MIGRKSAKVFLLVALLMNGRVVVSTQVAEVKKVQEEIIMNGVVGSLVPSQLVVGKYDELTNTKRHVVDKVEKAQVVVASDVKERGKESLGVFTVTAYDLNENCCSKRRTDEGFGITKSGFSLVGMTMGEARTVAVDPSVIELGTELYVDFEEPYESFSGIYYARDTGSKIKGKKIDLFMGDFGTEEVSDMVWEFGVRNAEVFIIN